MKKQKKKLSMIWMAKDLNKNMQLFDLPMFIKSNG